MGLNRACEEINRACAELNRACADTTRAGTKHAMRGGVQELNVLCARTLLCNGHEIVVIVIEYDS